MTAQARRSLLAQVFVANTSLIALAVVVLVFTPVSVSDPIPPDQAGVLLIGFVALLVGNLILLRRSLDPLRQLTRLMADIDPRARERLAAVPRLDSDVAALTDAFPRRAGPRCAVSPSPTPRLCAR
jgi:two-component system sensor histidine kinase UhpB